MTAKGIRVEVVDAELGETAERATARYELRPTVQAVRTTQRANPNAENVPLADLVAALNDQVKAVNKGDLSRPEAMLVVQAHTLDQLFNRLAKQAVSTTYLDPFQAAMRLALKAQAQCARTIGQAGHGDGQSHRHPRIRSDDAGHSRSAFVTDAGRLTP